MKRFGSLLLVAVLQGAYLRCLTNFFRETQNYASNPGGKRGKDVYN